MAIVFLELSAPVAMGLGMMFVMEYLFYLSNATAIAIVVLLASAVLGSLLTVLFNHRIIRPVRRMDAAMQKVAEGDFSVRLEGTSEIRDLENMRRSFNLMAQELGTNEMLQADFVSNVSHEFKTPINVIEGYATLLQDAPDVTGEQQEYIDRILLNTHRLSGLVENVLLLSKLENRAIPLSRAPFRMDEQIRQSVMMMESAWTKKDIEFDADLEDVTYVGSEGLMLHIWNNLISNAVKFSPQGGLIRLGLKREGGSIVFTIDDEGPGIAPEAQKHIFDKFYQADRSRVQEGNGLGLALLKRIVAVCGGEVSVRNREEGGCRFTVALPRDGAPAVPPSADAARQDEAEAPAQAAGRA